MRILFDNIIFSLQPSGGISSYWYELIKRINYDSIDCSFIQYENSKTNYNITRTFLTIPPEKIIRKNASFLKIQRYLPIGVELSEKTIVHSSYYRYSRSKHALNITTVHDFIYEYFVTGIRKTVHHCQKKSAIEHSTAIICVSENTKNDLLFFFPFIDPKIIRVIYNGVSQNFRYLNKQDHLAERLKSLKDKKVILYIGYRTRYKNFDVAIKTLKLLSDFDLAIVSGGFLTNQEIKILNGSIPNRYHYFSGLTEGELNNLYNNAFCLLYPSSYEGFGIPIIEAMSTGCPVITSNKSSIPEVAGKAALIVDKICPEDFAERILELEKNEVRKTIVLKGLMQASRFSWDKCYSEVVKLYNDIF